MGGIYDEHLSGGLIRTEDLRLLGLTDSERQVAVRGLASIRRGAHMITVPTDPRLLHLARLRAVLADRPTAMGSHISAATADDLPVPRQLLVHIHVSVLRGADRRGCRFGVHTHALPGGEVEIRRVNGIAVTGAAHTVIDCARMLSWQDAVVLADAAMNRGLTTQHEIRRSLRQQGRRHGIARARRAIDLSDPGAESPGETRTRLIVVLAGYAVRSQVVIHDANDAFIGRVDLLLDEAPVVLEFDGRLKYGLGGDVEEAHWQAKIRRDKLTNCGYQVVNVVWADLQHPSRIVSLVDDAVRRAGLDPTELRGH